MLATGLSKTRFGCKCPEFFAPHVVPKEVNLHLEEWLRCGRASNFQFGGKGCGPMRCVCVALEIKKCYGLGSKARTQTQRPGLLS